MLESIVPQSGLPRKSRRPANGVGLTSGIGHNLYVDIALILRDNLLRLFQFHRDNQTGRPTGHYELEEVTRIGKSTLYRIAPPKLPALKSKKGAEKGADNSARIGTLEQIGKPYGLRAWQLLVPHMDPAHPPELLTMEQQVELQTLRHFKRDILARAQKEQDEMGDGGRSDGHDGDGESKGHKRNPGGNRGKN
jgi:hypothetical protein